MVSLFWHAVEMAPGTVSVGSRTVTLPPIPVWECHRRWELNILISSGLSRRVLINTSPPISGWLVVGELSSDRVPNPVGEEGPELKFVGRI